MTVPAPRHADGYVSSREFAGPWIPTPCSVQRRQISDWTQSHGWRLGRIFEEPASACSGGATALEHALARVESRESGGVVVTRLHRVAATLDEALEAIARIQAAGGTFVSVRDGIDLSTASGRLTLRVLLSVVRWDYAHSSPR